MRKIIITVVAFSLIIFAGCGGKPTGYSYEFSDSDTTMASATITEPTVQETTTTATGATTSKAIQRAQVATTTKAEVTTKMTDIKTVDLNYVSKNSWGELRIKSAWVDYGNAAIILYFEFDSSKSLAFDYDGFSCVDSTGKKLNNGAIGGTIGWNSDRTSFITKDGMMEFYGFEDVSELTITYAFEGFDPVTVTINIPGV